MVTKYAVLGVAAVALAAVTAATTLGTACVFNVSGREAPRIMLDPAADNTDVFALPAHEGPGKLTAATNWVPLESPAGGPYFGKLDVV